jgi:hypothetical protein
VKTYIVCLPTPNHPNGGYYYNVRANSKRGILTTLRAIAISYRLPLDAIAAVNPLVTVDQELALNTSVCIAYV